MTSSVPKIILILGAGPNIGAALAKAFSAKGYKVASASRSPPKTTTDNDDGAAAALHIPVDLTRPETVPGVFERVRKELGGEVGVVVYNAAMFNFDPSDPLSQFTPASIQAYHDSQAVNATSPLFSLHESVKAFRNLSESSSLGADASKTFIFTGNMLNVKTLKGMLNFGLGKTATAYAIRHLVENKVYTDEGIKFYYADERTAEGLPVANDISGAAAADEYVKLAEQKGQGPWLYTFVKGVGYKDFERPGGHL